jgi:hypothetical protein
MVAAYGALHARAAMVMGWADANADARQAGDRLDHPDELRRTVRSPEMIEARCEIGDLDRTPMAVAHRGRDDRSVAEVRRAGFDEVFEYDVGKTLLLGPCKQSAEHRIAVEARRAPPHDPCGRIDESSRAAIADHGKVQSIVGHG